MSDRTPEGRAAVYVGMVGDLFHEGHLQLLAAAREYGPVTVGVLTDEATLSYKRLPILPFETRCRIIENIRGVERVVAQHSSDLRANLLALRPDIVVHGDDWRHRELTEQRRRCIETLEEWGGRLVEPPYTEDVSSTQLIADRLPKSELPCRRMLRLLHLLRHTDWVHWLRLDTVDDRAVDALVERSTAHSVAEIAADPPLWRSDPLAVLAAVERLTRETQNPLVVRLASTDPRHLERLVPLFAALGVSALVLEMEKSPVPSREASADHSEIALVETAVRERPVDTMAVWTTERSVSGADGALRLLAAADGGLCLRIEGAEAQSKSKSAHDDLPGDGYRRLDGVWKLVAASDSASPRRPRAERHS